LRRARDRKVADLWATPGPENIEIHVPSFSNEPHPSENKALPRGHTELRGEVGMRKRRVILDEYH